MAVRQQRRSIQCVIAGRRGDAAEVVARGLVQPVDLLVDLVVFVEEAREAANPQVIRSAQAEFVALVGVALDVVPRGAR